MQIQQKSPLGKLLKCVKKAFYICNLKTIEAVSFRKEYLCSKKFPRRQIWNKIHSHSYLNTLFLMRKHKMRSDLLWFSIFNKDLQISFLSEAGVKNLLFWTLYWWCRDNKLFLWHFFLILNYCKKYRGDSAVWMVASWAACPLRAALQAFKVKNGHIFISLELHRKYLRLKGTLKVKFCPTVLIVPNLVFPNKLWLVGDMPGQPWL